MGKYTEIDTPLDKINLHIRGGYILPTQDEALNTKIRYLMFEFRTRYAKFTKWIIIIIMMIRNNVSKQQRLQNRI